MPIDYCIIYIEPPINTCYFGSSQTKDTKCKWVSLLRKQVYMPNVNSLCFATILPKERYPVEEVSFLLYVCFYGLRLLTKNKRTGLVWQPNGI